MIWMIRLHRLNLSLLLTVQAAFVDSVDQDQTAQNVQSDLRSTLSTFPFWIRTELSLHLRNELYF